MIVKPNKRAYRGVRRAEAAEKTRAQILAAARRLLGGGKRSPAFSLEAVAKQAGVTRLTVYNRFESKLGLLEAVFDDMSRESRLMQDMSAVFTLPDPQAALRRFVSVMCRFWDFHRRALPRFDALTRLDDEVAASLKARKERRRIVLATLVQRLGSARDAAELVDLLYALTGFEMFDALSVHGRTAGVVEELMQATVSAAVARYVNVV